MAAPLITEIARLGFSAKKPGGKPKPDPRLRPPQPPGINIEPVTEMPVPPRLIPGPGGRRPGGKPPRALPGDTTAIIGQLYPPGTQANFKPIDVFKRRPPPRTAVNRALALKA